MSRSGRYLYRIFLCLACLSATGGIFWSVTVAALSDSGRSISWINLPLIMTVILSTLVMSIKGLRKPLKYFIIFLVPFVLNFISRYMLLLLPAKGLVQIVTDPALFILSAISALLLVAVMASLSSQLDFLLGLFDLDEKAIRIKMGDYPGRFITSGLTGYIFLYALLLLIAIFIAVLRDPGSSLVLSVYFILYCGGSAGLYMKLRQTIMLVKWKSEGLIAGTGLTRNWNFLILLELISAIALSVLVPWKYSVIRMDYVSSMVNKFLSAMSVNITLESEAAAPAPGSVRVSRTAPDLGSMDFKPALKILEHAVIILLTLYFILGFTGFIISKIYKGRKPPSWALIFIYFYSHMKWVLNVIVQVIKAVIGLAVSMFSLIFYRGEKPEKKDAALEKHLLSMFDSFNEMKDEKKDEIKTIVQKFMRFLAEVRPVQAYMFNMGPSEYVKGLSRRLPKYKDNLDSIADIFNESRYSTHLLPERKIEKFSGDTDLVIRGVKSGDFA